MFWAIWQLAARKTLLCYVPVFLLLTGYTILAMAPLGITARAAVFGGLQGGLLAFCLFFDSPRISAFVFSRPFSRTRLFLYRWIIGIVLQALTLVVVFAIIAFGLRQLAQVSMLYSPWYPMVRWFELSVLWPIGLASLLAYQTAFFLILLRQLHINRTTSKLRRLGNAAFAAFALPMAAAYVFRMLMVSEHFPMPCSGVVLVTYGALLTVMTTLAALYCCRHCEINA